MDTPFDEGLFGIETPLQVQMGLGNLSGWNHCRLFSADHAGHFCKSGRIIDSHIRKHFSVKINARVLKSADESAVGKAVFAGCSIDTDDP
jgi:hypothetical protein